MKSRKIFILIGALMVIGVLGVTACGIKEETPTTVEKPKEDEKEKVVLVGIDEEQPEEKPEVEETPKEPQEEKPETPTQPTTPTQPVTPTQPETPTQPKYSGNTGNQELNNLCDGILDSVITPNMNERQRLKAVYDWVETKIRYSGATAIGNWRTQAISVLKTRKGNCVAFCYASEALLTRLGVENIEIQTTNQDHFWNMVKYNGSWYHWDTTQGWGTERFLWTTSQIKTYTYKSIRYSPFDESKYPRTP